MLGKKPLTQREIRRMKEESDKGDLLTVFNKTKRMIPIQIREPSSDFFIGEQTIRIPSGKTYTDRSRVFNMNQLRNLEAKQEIKVSESKT